jgi:hypothetical protein
MGRNRRKSPRAVRSRADMVTAAAADTLEIPALTSGNVRDPDVVAALRNHYRLAQLQAGMSVRDAAVMGAGDLHLAGLREIEDNARMLAEGYLAEFKAMKSRTQREEVKRA